MIERRKHRELVSEFKCVGDVSNCNAHRDLKHNIQTLIKLTEL